MPSSTAVSVLLFGESHGSGYRCRIQEPGVQPSAAYHRSFQTFSSPATQQRAGVSDNERSSNTIRSYGERACRNEEGDGCGLPFLVARYSARLFFRSCLRTVGVASVHVNCSSCCFCCTRIFVRKWRGTMSGAGFATAMPRPSRKSSSTRMPAAATSVIPERCTRIVLLATQICASFGEMVLRYHNDFGPGLGLARFDCFDLYSIRSHARRMPRRVSNPRPYTEVYILRSTYFTHSNNQ